MEFEKNKEYGIAIEVVPQGEFSTFNGACFSGDWSHKNISTVKEMLRVKCEKLIPIELHGNIEWIIKDPDKDGSPLDVHGTVGWMYQPKSQTAGQGV